MVSSFPAAVPEIPVSDLNQALHYYQHSLGFTIDWIAQDLGLAGISKGNCRIFLADQQYRKAYGNIGPSLTWLNLDSKPSTTSTNPGPPLKRDCSQRRSRSHGVFTNLRRPIRTGIRFACFTTSEPQSGNSIIGTVKLLD
jgi:hypothetical protein